MTRVLRAAVGALMFFTGTASVFAQDAPKVGIFVSSPATAGLVWRVNAAITIRPDVQFHWTKFTAVSGGLSLGGTVVASSETQSTNRTVDVGVSVPITVARWQSLRAYVVPRAGYGWIRSIDEEIDTTPAGGSVFGSIVSNTISPKQSRTGRNYSASGSAGAEYQLGDRFGV